MQKRTIRINFIVISLVVLLSAVCYADPVALTDLQAIEIPQVGVAMLPASIVVNDAVPIEDTNNAISQWDMTAKTMESWHYARVIFYREDKVRSSLDMMEYVELKEPLLGMISDLAKGSIEKYAASHGVKLLQWYPVQKSALPKRNAIVFTAQMVLTDKFPLPMYGNIHVFVQDKRLNVLAFLCPDSDRKYWQPVFTQLAASLK